MNTIQPPFQQKIAYFCGTIESNKDGVSRVLTEIYRYNQKKKIPSLFVTPVGGKQDGMPYIKVCGIPVPRYEGYKLSIAPAHVIHRNIRQEQFQPSLIHLNSPCTIGRAGQKISAWLDVPCVATYHTHFPSYLKYHGFSHLEQPLRTFLRRFYNRCDTTIVPSKVLYKELQRDGIANLQYLPHGVDTQSFHRDFRSEAWREKILGADSDKKIVLYVGRLVWEKNLKLFAELVSDMSAERTDAQVVIVGTGPAEEELRAMMPSAIFLGLKVGRDLSEIYASSDIFLFPSDTETFGIVTLEALASGLPCVVADAGGSADLVSHNHTGFVVHPQKKNDWKTALYTLLDDTSKRQTMSNTAFEQAQYYQWENILRQMHTLYVDVQQDRQERAHTPHLVALYPTQTVIRHVPVQSAAL
jgi:phosphatidylinositol alpha 1,6-mannosyltransferase